MLLHRLKFQMFSAESNMMVKVVRYLPKSEAAVHRCLQPFTEKRLFMSISFTKVGGLQPKQDSARDVFLWFCLIFQSTFFAKHILVVTASVKYHSFSLFCRSHLQNVTLDLSFLEQTMWVACKQLFLEVQDN